MSGAVGTSATHFTFWTHDLFVQDDWKISRELTLNYGLRWEYVGPPKPIDQELNHVYGFDFNTGKQLFPSLGQIRPSIVKPDYKDFAPRVGLAYNPRWAQTFVLRGGIGIYYDQTQMNETQFITNGPPIFTQQNYNFTGRGLPDYQFGTNTLPAVVVPDANYVTPAGTNLFVQEIDGRKPRVYMWTASVQKSFGTNWLLEVAYAGSHGRRLSKRYNAYSNLTPGVLYDVTPGVATRYPQLNQMLYSSQSGWSNFNGLNLKLERRFANGFQILMAHTWSKSIDDDSAGSFGSPNLNPANFQLDKGPSDFDIRHRWISSVLYQLPFGREKWFLSGVGRAADLVVGGWQVNAIPSWQTGVQRRHVAEPDGHLLRHSACGCHRHRPRGNVQRHRTRRGFRRRQYVAVLVPSGRVLGNETAEIRHLRTRHHHGPVLVEHGLVSVQELHNTRGDEDPVPGGGVQRVEQREVLPARHERRESDLRYLAECGTGRA